MSVRAALENFRKLLIVYWETINKILPCDNYETFKDDWLQANWELIVEGFLGDSDFVLLQYGDGADVYGTSSRVLFPDRAYNHLFICCPRPGEPVRDCLGGHMINSQANEIVFDRFVSMGDDGWYHETPPFDMILGNHAGKDVVVKFGCVDVTVRKITKSDLKKYGI